MTLELRSLFPALVLCGMLFPAAAPAEITSIAGQAEVSLREFRFGEPGDTDQAIDTFPGTAEALPLQVFARLIDSEPNEPAAAAIGAQFADPTELIQPNPEEFAINLSLNSLTPHVRYEASARTEEMRGVLFAANELGIGSADRDVETLTGVLFLDGALVLLAGDPTQDLTGAEVTLRVVVEKVSESGGTEVVFDGELALSGGAGGAVTVSASGDFPVTRVVLSDLGVVEELFGVFQVLIIPRIEIEYEYSATVGEPFELRAAVEIEAANQPNVATAAVIGAPTDAINDVISITENPDLAAKLLSALARERENPTGQLAFPEEPTPMAGFCGLVGFEAAALVSALFAWSAARRRDLGR